MKTFLDRGNSGPKSKGKENNKHRLERQAFNKNRRRKIRYGGNMSILETNFDINPQVNAPEDREYTPADLEESTPEDFAGFAEQMEDEEDILEGVDEDDSPDLRNLGA